MHMNAATGTRTRNSAQALHLQSLERPDLLWLVELVSHQRKHILVSDALLVVREGLRARIQIGGTGYAGQAFHTRAHFVSKPSLLPLQKAVDMRDRPWLW